jgi:aryl-alcohol dehydrogenase-like predicted oxidoreductase
MLPVPGTTCAVHLRENLDSQDIQVSVDEILAIDGIAPEAV